MGGRTMKKPAIIVFVLIIVVCLCQSFSTARGAINVGEIEFMKETFAVEIGNSANFDSSYINLTRQYALLRIFQNPEITSSQYLIYADRNPREQNIYICFYDADRKDIIFVGGTKISTGNGNRHGDFFETPAGFFDNDPKILGYRALGTKNKKGWMGLGVKKSRVWDFGWQKTVKYGHSCEIRLLMHATDPNFGEPRLGSIDFKGCVRLSNKMAAFIDHFGFIDRKYEESQDRTRRALLAPGRRPVQNAGSFLLVGDSREFLMAHK